MKRAGPATLGRIEPLLAMLRQRGPLVEKKPGVFYWRGQAFLHFHEDPAGIFADLKQGAEWQRMAVDAASAWEPFMAMVDDSLDQ